MKAAVVGIFAAVICFIILPVLAKRSAIKARTNAADRRLIEIKIRAAHICRWAIAAEVLIVVATLFVVLTSQKARVPESVFIAYLVALLGIIGLRSVFRQMKMAAEIELEYHQLRGQKA